MKIINNNSNYNRFAYKNWQLWLTLSLLYILLTLTVPIDLFWTVKNHTITENVRATEEGNLGRQLSVLGIFILALVNIIRKHPNKFKINGIISWISIFLIFWSALSIVWSDDIVLTAKRVFVLFSIILMAAQIAKICPYRKIIVFTLTTCCINVVLSIGSELWFSTFNPLQIEYRFSGIMHPNQQGVNCAAIIIAAVSLSISHVKNKYFYLITGFVGSLFLIMTKSRTAIVSVFVAIMVYATFWVQNVKKAILIIFLVLLVIPILYFTVWDNLVGKTGSVIEILSRGEPDPGATFEGRVRLWKNCLRYLGEHPIEGYGYGSFWTPRRLKQIATSEGWELGSAHSKYIDLSLELGLIGSTCYLIILLLCIKSSYVSYVYSRNYEYAFSSAFLVLIFVNGLTESLGVEAFIPNFICLVLIVKIAFYDGSLTRRNFEIRRAFVSH